MSVKLTRWCLFSGIFLEDRSDNSESREIQPEVSNKCPERSDNRLTALLFKAEII